MTSLTRQSKTLASFEPFREQEEFLRGDKRYLGYISGVGAGKTYAGIIRTFLNMEKWNVGEMGAIVAPTRQMVVNVIIPEMRDLGLLDKWEYKSSYSDEPGLHSPNGSRALILSADNDRTIERLRGLNLAWGWIDEEAVVDPRARDILMQRLRTGSYRNLYITTTPKGKNHTYDFFVGDVQADKQRLGNATIYETADRVAIVGVPTGANPHTPEDYKDAMEADLPEEIRAQEVEGEFIEIGSGIFTREMLEFISIEEVKEIGEERNFSYLTAVDVGVEADAQKARDNDTDYWAAALLMVNSFDGEAYLIDVKRERGMSLKQGVEWLRGVVKDVPKGSPIYVESNQSQVWFKDALKEAGLNAVAEINTTGKEDRLIQMSIPLERGDVKVLNRDPDDQLGYDPRWRPWVQELLSFPDGQHDDLIDATELAIRKADIGGTHKNILSADPYGGDE